MKLRINRDMIRSATFIFKMSIALAYLVSLLSFILAFAMSSHFTWRLWLDTIFILALVLLGVGGSLFIIQGGFFNRKSHHGEDVVQEVDGAHSTAMAVQKQGRSIHTSTKVMLVSGWIIVVVTMLISYLTT